MNFSEYYLQGFQFSKNILAMFVLYAIMDYLYMLRWDVIEIVFVVKKRNIVTIKYIVYIVYSDFV